MSVRTDLHRPSVIVPADYDFVSMDYWGPSPMEASFLVSERAYFRQHKERTGGHEFYKNNDTTGSCDVCGAHAHYVGRFYHKPTNAYVTLGHDCAAKMEIGDQHAFASFHKKVRAGIEAHAGKRKAESILEAAGLSAAWAVRSGEYPRGVPYEERTIMDITNNVIRYGNMSDKQKAFVRSLLTRIERRAQVAADRAAQNAAAKPVPVTEDRVVITGKVLTTKVQDSIYGSQIKMLVQNSEGWKLWGTVPGSLDVEGLRGKTVRFKARIEPSKDDPKFGFFSRPTAAEIVQEVVELV